MKKISVPIFSKESFIQYLSTRFSLAKTANYKIRSNGDIISFFFNDTVDEKELAALHKNLSVWALSEATKYQSTHVLANNQIKMAEKAILEANQLVETANGSVAESSRSLDAALIQIATLEDTIVEKDKRNTATMENIGELHKLLKAKWPGKRTDAIYQFVCKFLFPENS